MDDDLALLHRLVGDIDHFADHHWGQRSMLRSSGTTFHDVLDLDGIEALLASSARRPTFRLVRDGATLPAERSTKSVRLGGQQLDDVADLGRIASAVDEGATLVLQGLQRTSLRLADVCRSLERATSHPVQANAYLTPAGSAGLARHHDDHDVLVLQLMGSKTWDLDDLGPCGTVAGDVLYIPAGVRHEASAQDTPSLHLTIGLLRVTRRDVVRRALQAVDGLDQPLSLGYARPDQTASVVEDIRAALAAVSTALASGSPDDLATQEVARSRRRRSPVPLGQLRSILTLDDVTTTTTVSRRLDQPAELVDEGREDGRLTLVLADRRVHLPAVGRAAVEHLLAVESASVGALPGVDSESQVVLVKRLVRDGLLVVRTSTD